MMKWVLLCAALAVASASVVKDDVMNVLIGKETLVTTDIKTKELCIMKLLNHILQPTMYDDVREVAREWVIEENHEMYLKVEVVKDFIHMYKMGMLPRGEVFVHTNDRHLMEAIRVFKLLYYAKDFDVFIRTACWLRERINPGMFVYALTCCCFHRADCRGIVLPAPYEIYPYFFVDSDIINKAFIMKMTKAMHDPVLMDYYGIKVTDKNLVVIDWRKGVRQGLTHEDKLCYFREDIDLNTFMYYLHMNFPFWMTNEVYGVHKERRGEVVMYVYQQLLARLRLERLARGMCDIKMLEMHETLKEGYWPKLRLHNGWEMPVRSNRVKILTKHNVKVKLLIEDLERFIREGIIKGKIELRDGTVITLKKTEDIELLARLILGGIGFTHDDAKLLNLVTMFKKLLRYSMYNEDKYTYIPTALDMYTTCLRDPVFWRILKRIQDCFVLFKKMLPVYTRDEFDFPGIKVEGITTDKLVTFMDEYDVDITNAMWLDDAELKKKHSDMVFIGRKRRLNNHPFKVTIDVVSDKAVDAVVRIFLGPKFDCMGRLIGINDKRMDMFEIDSFLYKLDTGKNTIVRNSMEMHNVIGDRPMTRMIWDKVMDTTGVVSGRMVDHWWFKSRVGFPHRLLLPLGMLGGMHMQLFVIVTPVRKGLVLPMIDIDMMKDRRVCYFTTCIDTMPLGFPFDRHIDVTKFFTPNMKFHDVKIYRKDLTTMNAVKDVDMTDMVMKRDDLTMLDSDMMVRWSYRDVMLMSTDRMNRM
ncbi:basic juvenile hormone-suppressible protein 1-like [Pectinophora gossypiella]|nr:basic juvenile hormone-suppressible protein 1-like [Pectinophora gossypiella]